MNDNDYYKWINKMNNDYDKNMRQKNRIQYIKNNLLAIIDLFLTIVAIIISIIALCNK